MTAGRMKPLPVAKAPSGEGMARSLVIVHRALCCRVDPQGFTFPLQGFLVGVATRLLLLQLADDGFKPSKHYYLFFVREVGGALDSDGIPPLLAEGFAFHRRGCIHVGILPTLALHNPL